MVPSMDPSNVYDLWEGEDSTLCPLSTRQTAFLQQLESISKAANEKRAELHDSAAQSDTGGGKALASFEDSLCHLSKECENDVQTRVASLNMDLEKCKQLSGIVEDILENLYYLKKMHASGLSKTFPVHSSCGEIIEQEQGLIITVEAIKEKLKYFNELDAMDKKLGSPSILTLSESLMPSLARLEECINFFQSRPSYKESAVFLFKMKHLENNTLQFVKKHVINSIQSTCKQVMPESGEILSPGDNVFTLFYARFQATSQRIKSLMALIEERSHLQPEYQEYIHDCHEAFFKARETLIVPVLTAAIEDMVSQHGKSYCALTRNTCRMLMHICKDEYTLYSQFFSKQSSFLTDFLELLCSHLYNVLRPIVIHINHLETLSELCCIIKQEVIEDFVVTDGSETLTFGRVMNQLLEDVQERLVYRTNIYIHSNIIQYDPAPGDLAYPEKLEMMENITECVFNQSSLHRSDSLTSIASTAISDISFATHADARNDFRSRGNSKSPADIYGMWYPTVRRTIVCLTKLYRSLDRSAFLGLAQDVVAGCLQSLQRASQEICKNKTPADGFLFLIKHLLIVREQIAPFRIECTIREVEIDFAKIKTAAINLLHNGKNIFSLKSNNGLLQFLFEVPTAPQIIDHVFDPQKIVDSQIRSACEKFISLSTNNLLSPITPHLELLRRCSKSASNLCPSEPEEVNKALDDLQKHIDSTSPAIRRAMALYLANPDTENILFKPIKSNCMKQFEELRRYVIVVYDKEKQAKIELMSSNLLEGL